jgi:hypothetical protein
MTPEGRVKRKVSELLKTFPSVYSFMPVQHGLGASGLDYHCVVGKMFQFGLVAEMIPIAFFIETKKPGDKPTTRQAEFIKDRKNLQNARTFIIDEDPTINKGKGLDDLALWLGEIERNNERIRSVFPQPHYP